MSLDRGEQVPKSDARQKDHHVDPARDQPIGEVDCLAILLDRYFAHARADERPPAEFFDQPGDFGAIPAFERGDAEVVE
jgi:predicted SpoU family rRNA methylase